MPGPAALPNCVWTALTRDNTRWPPGTGDAGHLASVGVVGSRRGDTITMVSGGPLLWSGSSLSGHTKSRIVVKAKGSLSSFARCGATEAWTVGIICGMLCAEGGWYTGGPLMHVRLKSLALGMFTDPGTHPYLGCPRVSEKPFVLKSLMNVWAGCTVVGGKTYGDSR
eukprot:CAMPEP_0194526112 /NCGR_PEP_ID=MMETSP0253-20130528/61841_1 /TAXON_ID=2966 /ORGANISM="Noctiluca scintillans" /LENGTH=166 /DNA_ID=CAMNT_0039370911 /DNA_START=263 /DNA_END=763 /DNA_ORIENTATION=-